jgi:hypothetical protein
MYGAVPSMIALAPSTASTDQADDHSCGSSQLSSQSATIASCPRTGSSHGCYRYSAFSVNSARMSASSLLVDAHT